MAHYRRWIEGNPVSGGTELILEGNDLVLHTRFDAEPIIEQNKRERSYQQHGSAKLGAKKAASIPTPLYFQWKKEWYRKHRGKWSWHTFLAMRLNSRDYSYLRTSDMKL